MSHSTSSPVTIEDVTEATVSGMLRALGTRGLPRPPAPIPMIPTEKTLAALEAAQDKALSQPPARSKEDRESLLETYLDEVHTILLRPDAYKTGGEREEGTAQLMRTAKRLATSSQASVGASAARRDDELDSCDKALVRGIAGITVGAATGGPLGAFGGFVIGIVDLALEC